MKEEFKLLADEFSSDKLLRKANKIQLLEGLKDQLKDSGSDDLDELNDYIDIKIYYVNTLLK